MKISCEKKKYWRDTFPFTICSVFVKINGNCSPIKSDTSHDAESPLDWLHNIDYKSQKQVFEVKISCGIFQKLDTPPFTLLLVAFRVKEFGKDVERWFRAV